MNYLLISSLRERIENQRMEVHTLSLKSESIKEEVEHIQKLINVKPLESISEELNPSESVMNILQNLVDKIEKTKPVQNNYAFSSKHNISNILPFKKTCKSTIKKNVTSIKKFGNCTNINLARSLFGDSFKTTENAVIDRMEELASPNQSAELLPESCFNFRSDDEFLIPFQTSYPLRNSKVDCNDDLLGNENIFENTIDQTKSLSKRKRDYFETIHLNNYVKQTVEEIFEGANRRFIWASICALRENLLRDIELGIAENMLNLR
ncbi:hypothetical protein HHI36_000463 [Cryptolaemus montrouzieri]|uniref:Uncharacterized protein n=1 Tax=Cryptolaemus montrouzieri TaxID=559131 RepID=A0ABD2P511_9CUCU